MSPLLEFGDADVTEMQQCKDKSETGVRSLC